MRRGLPVDPRGVDAVHTHPRYTRILRGVASLHRFLQPRNCRRSKGGKAIPRQRTGPRRHPSDVALVRHSPCGGDHRSPAREAVGSDPEGTPPGPPASGGSDTAATADVLCLQLTWTEDR